jgi:DNA anti-recombination protein RmuC
MSAGNWFADAAALAALASAGWTWWRGWRKRDQDRAAAAATAPFTSGREVADEAQRVLLLRAAALEESERAQKALRDRNAELREQNADLQAQNGAQATQINELYAKTGTLTAENSELAEKVRCATIREELDRRRIAELEARVDELSKAVGLGQYGARSAEEG